MADRTVTYSFKGNFTNLTAGLTAAGRNVTELGTKMTALDKNGAKMRTGLKTVGDTAGKMGVVAAAGLGAMVFAAARFDQAMSKVQAATHETSGNMELLRKAAIKAGADTQYSASEAAGAIEALAKAGLSTKDILGGGLSGALNLAAAGTIDVSQAADIAATTLNQFGLAGDQTSHVADVLAAAAGKAQGEVTDMAQALKYVGPVAAQMGVSLEETSGAIAELASQGILGDQAGTSLRGMLTSLTSPSQIAAQQMLDLGISVYDAQGKFVGFDGIAGQLHDTMSNLTAAERDQALGRIFGNEQITAARILYAGGAAAVDKWTKAVDDQGYAAETAHLKMDNLAGDFEQLKGSLETALIGGGEGAQGPLRKLTQGTTQLVNALNGLPGPAKNTATALLGIAAVTGGATWFGAKVIAGITEMKTALNALGIEAATTREKLALVGTGGAAAALGVGAFMNTITQMDSWKRSSEAADATAKSYQDLSDALSYSNVGKYADDLHINLGRLTDDLVQNGTQGEYVSRVMDQLSSSGHGVGAMFNAELGHITLGQFGGSAEKAADANKDLLAIIKNSGDVLGKGATATDAAAAANDNAAGATRHLGTAADRTQGDVMALNKAIEASRKDANKTAQSFVAFGNNLSNTKVSLNQWIKSMQRQAEALKNFRINAEQAAKKGLDQGLIASLEKAGPAGALRMKQLANATKTQIAAANGAWQSGQHQVDKYTDAIGGIPKAVTTNVNVNTGRAFDQIGAVAYALAQLHDKTITINTVRQTSNLNKLSGIPVSADGSTVPKTGLPYADRHLYLLADGEEVISNRHGQADRHRPLLKAINAGRLADGGTAGKDKQTPEEKAHEKHLHSLNATLEKLNKALDKETKLRDDLRQKAQDLRSGVAGGLRSDIFAAPSSPWAAGASANPLGTLRTDIRSAHHFTDLVKQLKSKGVHGAALAEIISTGDVQRAELMAQMSRADLATYENLYKQREQAIGQAGQAASQAMGYPAQISRVVHEIHGLHGAIHRVEQAIHASEKKAHHSRQQAADSTGKHVNGAAASGKRRAA